MSNADDSIPTPRPRLLIIGPLPPPYIGPAVATERLVASPIMHSMFDVDLLNTGDPGGEDDIGQLSLHNIREALSQAMRYLGRLIRKRPDVIYVSIARGFWGFLRDVCFLLPAKLFGVRSVIHLRAGRFDLIHDDGLRGRLLARVGLWCTTYAVVLGETVRGIFGDFIAQDRVVVVPNGIDLEAWPRPGDREQSHDTGEQQGRFHLVYLANLFSDKGAHILLQALPQIIARCPDVLVSFAGAWLNAEYREQCLGLVQTNGLEHNVRFVGVVRGEAKRELLLSADVSVFVPIKPEGLPWVVLEAMACCKPVVGTPQGTMKEVIVDGETGYLVPPEDVGALTETLLLLAADPERRRRMGASARARVETVYAETECHKRLAATAMRAIQGPGAGR